MLPIEIDAGDHLPLGMSPTAFLRDYWQKRPLLIRGGFAGWACPISPEDLAGLACEELALSRIVQHERIGDRWSVRQGPFAESLFPALPATDWTLLVQDVDKWDLDVRQLLSAFDFIPRWRIDDIMVSFAAPGGSVGAHVDHYDVFLLQGQGHRRWQIDAGRQPPLEFRDDVELKLLREFSPSHDWLLRPGDMLYLPPGVPHHGVAEDACLTFSIGMRAPALSELVGDLADHLTDTLPEALRYTDPDLQPASAAGEIDRAALDRVRALLQRATDLDDRALAGWLGGFLTRYRSAGDGAAPARRVSAAQLLRVLAAGGCLLHHPFARFAWTREGRSARLFVQGQSWPLPQNAAKRLCLAQPLLEQDYRRFDAASHTVLRALLDAGLLVLQRARR